MTKAGEKMQDRRGVEIEKIDPETSEVIMETGEIVAGNFCDIYLGGGHYAASCTDHYRPWV